MSELLYLPVSLGEAIDKLTILDIKLQKITDNRKNDVKIEYDILFEKLRIFILQYDELYNTMKKVNLIIWDMMDKIRDINITDTQYLEICRECVELNDIRFRIKNKINNISKSVLKEQKGYNINGIIINLDATHLQCKTTDTTTDTTIDTTIDIINLIIPIKYCSLVYDYINITYKNDSNSIDKSNLQILIKYFHYDPTIKFINIDKENDHTNKITKTIVIEKDDYINLETICKKLEINDKMFGYIILPN
jgi:hypothetical protein